MDRHADPALQPHNSSWYTFYCFSVCDVGFWGENCKVSCAQNCGGEGHFESCNAMNGNCICNECWEGETCDSGMKSSLLLKPCHFIIPSFFSYCRGRWLCLCTEISQICRQGSAIQNTIGSTQVILNILNLGMYRILMTLVGTCLWLTQIACWAWQKNW